MSAELKTLSDYINALDRQKWRALGVFAIVFIVAAGVAFGLTSTYKSRATILIEQQQIPEDLVRSTITSYADQRIQVISQRVMTRLNLIEIIKEFDLYPELRKREPIEVVLEKLRDDISMQTVSADVVDPRNGRPVQATIAFTLAYEHESPKLAQKVTNNIVSLYLKENLKSRSETVSETSEFLEEETKRLNKEISELERKLAVFKKENVNRLPDLMSFNMQLIERTEMRIQEISRDMRALKEDKIYLESQLAHIEPNSQLFTEGGARVLGAKDRLRLLKNDYLSKSAKYSEKHPDMQKMRLEIAGLEKEVGGVDRTKELYQKYKVLDSILDQLKEKYSEQHPDVKRYELELVRIKKALEQAKKAKLELEESIEPDNPAFIQIQTRLNAVNTEYNSLNQQYKELTGKLAQYEARVTSSPQIEREYKLLTRNYENAWKKYQELRAKQLEAKIAENLETERKGERFELIEPPQLPEKPIKPNRPLLLVLGLVLAFGAALGVVSLSESIDQSIRSQKDIYSLTEQEPLGLIPLIVTDSDRKKAVKGRVIFGLGTVGSVFAAVIVVHEFVKPLDVLWFVALRKLGM